MDKVCKYILNQPKHHKKISFEEEYPQFIKYYQDFLKNNKVNKVFLPGIDIATKVILFEIRF